MQANRDTNLYHDAVAKRDLRFGEIPAHRTLASIIADNLERFGTYEALHFRGERHTNTDLVRQASKLAGVLASAGVGRGDRVIVNLTNCPEIWTCYLACTALGAVIVPTVPSWTIDELGFVAMDSEASVIVTAPEKAGFFETARADFPALRAVYSCDLTSGTLRTLIEAAAAYADALTPAADDLAAIIYTSGTTGRPKGVMLTHGNLCRQACLNYGFYVGPGEDARAATLLMPLPMCHVFGIAVALTSLLMGNLMVMMERFEPGAALELIHAHRVRIVPAVPTMLIRLLAEPDAAPRCRSVTQWDCGGSALPVELLEQVENRLGGVCTEGWGLSEASSAVVQNVPSVPQKKGSVGLVLPGLEIAVRDADGAPCPANVPGELLVRGETVMQGYWKRPDATAQALDSEGFLHTGDVGYVDEDGYCFIVGRMDDLIISGGRNISPREIEEAIQGIPAVREVAVVGLPHDELGQVPGAFVVAGEGMVLDEDEVIEYCRSRLAPYKAPRCVRVLAELPHNATGKVIKEELRRRFADRV